MTNWFSIPGSVDIDGKIDVVHPECCGGCSAVRTHEIKLTPSSQNPPAWHCGSLSDAVGKTVMHETRGLRCVSSLIRHDVRRLESALRLELCVVHLGRILTSHEEIRRVHVKSDRSVISVSCMRISDQTYQCENVRDRRHGTVVSSQKN